MQQNVHERMRDPSKVSFFPSIFKSILLVPFFIQYSFDNYTKSHKNITIFPEKKKNIHTPEPEVTEVPDESGSSDDHSDIEEESNDNVKSDVSKGCKCLKILRATFIRVRVQN